ncbi:unnamed protein product [Durusdinium trenchii]|uniref:Uncharacterized protein n=1 Tax=Durusdinium trenchii TaxID=1381693 RepID=A0ABP0MD47_9DINO
MKIRKHELYREDIRDLTDLTVSKMDVYMVINVLQLLFCVMLFTEGMPSPGSTPLWLHWILAATSGSGVLYFVLSIWLSMHASIAAHSFGVRMLTQFVRLPVPNLQQIDSAAAKAKDYEAMSLGQILRIPVLQQQLRKLTATMGDLQSDELEDTTGQEDNFLPEVAGVSIEEAATLKPSTQHSQAHPAVQRPASELAGVLLSETKTGWAAASCMAVVSCAAWLIIRRVTRTRPTRRVTDAAARRPSTRASATRARVFTAWVWCDKSSPFCLNMYTQTPWPNGRPVHFLKLPGSWEVSLSIRLSSVSCLVRHDQMMSRPDDRERQDPMNPNTCPRAKKRS